MPYRCVVPRCKNSANHKFPGDRKLCYKWRLAIRRAKSKYVLWTPKASSRICAAHFREDDFYTECICTTGTPNKRLRRTAVPSIFPRRTPATSTTRNEPQVKSDRARRAESRAIAMDRVIGPEQHRGIIGSTSASRQEEMVTDELHQENTIHCNKDNNKLRLSSQSNDALTKSVEHDSIQMDDDLVEKKEVRSPEESVRCVLIPSPNEVVSRESQIHDPKGSNRCVLSSSSNEVDFRDSQIFHPEESELCLPVNLPYEDVDDEIKANRLEFSEDAFGTHFILPINLEVEKRLECDNIITFGHQSDKKGVEEWEPNEQTDAKEVTREVQTTLLPVDHFESELQDKAVQAYLSTFDVEAFANDSQAIQYFTGFKDFEHFMYLFTCLEPAIHGLDYRCRQLTRKNELFLTLIKLRTNKPDLELQFLFGISSTLVPKVFDTMLRFLYFHLKDMMPWLPKDICKIYTPIDFGRKCPNTRVILDATEVFIERPSNIKSQAASWSTYKHHNTLKTVIGINPRGVVTYVSDVYGGSTSDRQIIERSKLLQDGMFEKDDVIMADRGMMVQDLFASQGVTVKTPHTMRGKSQLDPVDVVNDRRVASKRIHVERVIGLAKRFRILKSEMTRHLVPKSSLIIFVCFALCNFKGCIVNKSS